MYFLGMKVITENFNTKNLHKNKELEQVANNEDGLLNSC